LRYGNAAAGPVRLERFVVFTIIRLLYDAVLAIALSVVVAILCGSIAGVIVGASGPNLPVSAIAFLLTGAVLLFRLWRDSVPSVHIGV
jgi:hypothetical protein